MKLERLVPILALAALALTVAPVEAQRPTIPGWPIFGGSPGPPGPQGPPGPPSGLIVVDANGAEVGAAFDNPIVPTVLIHVGQRLIPLFVAKDSFLATAQLVFQSLDCTGPPFMRAPNGPSSIRGLVDSAAIGPPGATAYQPDLNVPSQAIIYKSLFSGGVPLPAPCSQVAEGETILAFPAVAIIDLSTQFTPPFSYK